MNRQYSRFTVPDWLKWAVAIVFLLLVSCLSYSVYLYNEIQQQKTAPFDQVTKEVLRTTDLVNIESIERFHGDHAYYVVFGTTNDNKEKAIFYPFTEKKEEVISISTSEIMQEGSIQSQWEEQCSNCKLIDITPAIIGEDSQPAWELTYTDSSGRYVIDYWSMDDGTRIEMIGFKQMFN
ncbi:DUF5590 domain-containing protein [Virgibacillus kekensis]|uniref:DUF5590 domain-containing protein n=1 Tax=Virgibacillus kekensis TaxID=202261 RepID=A0ABV9DG71_9BACI